MSLLLRRSQLFAAFLFTAGLAACSAEPDTRVLTTLTIKVSKPFAVVGQTIQATAGGLDQFGKSIDPGPVVWSAELPFATVSASGAITGVYEGVSIIQLSAKNGELTSERRLSVSKTSDVRLSPSLSFVVRNGVPFTHVVWFANASGNIVPITGVKLKATITGGGTITGLDTATSSGGATFVNQVITGASGKRTITYTADGFAPVTTTVTVVSGVAKNFAIVSGNNQTGSRGGGLAPISVRVTDEDGYGVANVPVSFTVASGGGSLQNTNQVTQANGAAETNLWILGAVGINTVVATAQGIAGSLTFSATATPVTARVELSLPKTTIQVGESIQAILQGFTDTGAPYLPPAFVRWVIDGNRSATVTNDGIVSGTSPGTATLIVFVNSVGTSVPITVIGTATRTFAVTSGTIFAPSATILPTVVVQLVDVTTGLPIAESGHAVSVAILGGGFNAIPKLTGQTTVSTDATGAARFTALTLTAPPQGMGFSFRSDGVIPILVPAGVSVGAPATIVIEEGNNQSGVVGEPTPTRPSVRLRDAAGTALTPGVPVTFTVTSGGGTVTSATVVTTEGGIATVGSWILGALGTNSLSVSSPGIATPAIFTAIARPF